MSDTSDAIPSDFSEELTKALEGAWKGKQSLFPNKKKRYTSIDSKDLAAQSKKVLAHLQKKYSDPALSAALSALATDQLDADENTLTIESISINATLFIDLGYDPKNTDAIIKSIQRELLIDTWFSTDPNKDKLSIAEQAFQIALQQFIRDPERHGPSFYRGRRRLTRLIALSLSLSDSSSIVRILQDLWDEEIDDWKSSHSPFYETGTTMQELGRIGILEVLSSDGLTPAKATLLFRADPDATPMYILTEDETCEKPELQAVVRELVSMQLVNPSAGLAPFLWELQEFHDSELVIGACRLIEKLKLTKKQFKKEPRFNKAGNYRREVWAGVQALLSQNAAFQANEDAKSFKARLVKERFKATTVKLVQGFVSEPYRAVFFDIGATKNDQIRVKTKHQQRIQQIAIGARGGAITLSNDGLLSFWSEELEELQSHQLFKTTSTARSVALSPSGNYAAATMATKKVVLYQIDGLEVSEGISSEALPCSDGLCVTDEGIAFIGLEKGFARFNAESKELTQHKIKNKVENVTKILASQSGTYVALGQQLGSLHVLEWPNLKPLFSIRGDYSEPLAFCEDESLFVSEHLSGLRLSSVPEGKKLKNKLRRADSNPFASSANGEYILCKSNESLKSNLIRFHLGEKQSTKVLEKLNLYYDSGAISNDGKAFYSTSSSDGKAHYLHKWDPD